MKEPTELDHQGAVIWVECPLCGASRNSACASLFFIGPDLFLCPPGEGEVHDMRMKKWLELKARVSAGAGWHRRPNIQQIPRKND